MLDIITSKTSALARLPPPDTYHYGNATMTFDEFLDELDYKLK